MFDAPAVQERPTEQVIGFVEEVVQKGPGKWQAVVRTDNGQGRRLWIGNQGIAQTIYSAIGQRLGFDCSVSSYVSQHTGQPARSLWVNTVGAAAPGSPAMAGPPQQATVVQPTVVGTNVPMAPVSQDSTERKIHRQTATKVAAILLSNLAPEQRNLSTLLELAERLVRYYDYGLPAAPTTPTTLDEEIQRAMPQSVDEMIAPDVPEYHGDDDIPF